jgi:hypothetical protein
MENRGRRAPTASAAISNTSRSGMNRSETMYRSLPTLQHADGHKVTVGVKAYGGDGQPCRLPMDDITVEHWPVGR